LIGMGRAWMVGLGIFVGCGPRILLDQGEATDDGPAESSASTTSGSSGPSETGGPPVPVPVTSFGSSGTDESTGFPGSTGQVDGDLCPHIQAESVYCFGSTQTGMYMIGADTGTSCAIDVPGFGVDTSSLAWIGDDVFACPRDGSGESWLTRASLLDGSLEPSEVPCEAVAAYHGALLLMPTPAHGGAYLVYNSFADAIAGMQSRVIDVSPFASRMTVGDDVLYAAWHSTDRLEVWDLATESERDPIRLENHDGWVNGIAVVDNRLFLVSRLPDSVFIEFDATTGARVAEHALVSASPEGLACGRGG
jgi:hypothetical protein